MSKINIPEPKRFRSDAYLAVLAKEDSRQSCIFRPQAMADMRLIAQTGYPDEICGLLVGKPSLEGWHVEEIRQVENLNKERAADRFQLDPAGFQRVDSELRGSGQEIIGVFHSHPDCPAKPSPTDLTSAWEGFVYPIVSVCEGEVVEVHCWVITEDVQQGGVFQRLPHQA